MTLGFVLFSVFFLAAFGVDSASGNGVSVSNHTLNINTTTQVNAHVPIEKIWNGLSKVHRYPIINSGDIIALRWAYTFHYWYRRYWLRCTTSNCHWSTCQSSTTTDTKWWSSCSSYSMFTITAKGKMHGQPIDSGDTVSLSSNHYGNSYRLYCTASYNTYCCVRKLTSSMTGSDWLTYSQATFQIFSKNAVEGTPVQYGDVVGFKYPYSSNSAWFTYYRSSFYPRSCSCCSKSSCAKENTNTGFKIFKKLS